MLQEYTQLGGEFEQIVHEFGDTMVSAAAQAGRLNCGNCGSAFSLSLAMRVTHHHDAHGGWPVQFSCASAV
jgi:hypothetical protein